MMEREYLCTTTSGHVVGMFKRYDGDYAITVDNRIVATVDYKGDAYREYNATIVNN